MYFEPQQIERWSRHLREAADELDHADKSGPDSLDAGPFSAVVVDMVEATVAQYAHLVLRLDEASDRLQDVAAYYRHAEDTNLEAVVKVGDSMWPLASPLDGERRRAWDGSDADGNS
jgi:hypothetical protein